MVASTLQSLRDRAKRRVNMDATATSSSPTFVTDAEWNDYINSGGGELHDLIIEADPTAVVKSTTITTVANQTVYNLPSDFYKVSSFFQNIVPGKLLDMDSMSAHDLANFSMGAVDYYNLTRGSSPYKYYIEGLTVEFRPIPTGQVFLLKYIPQFVRLVDDLSPIDYPAVNGWDEYIVVAAGMKALIKEGSEINDLEAERQRIEMRIKRMAANKDNFSPRRIRDVYGSTRTFYRHFLPQR